MTLPEMLAVLHAKAQVHPELHDLDWTGFRRILAREDVALVSVPLAKSSARLQYFDGAWAILINSARPPRRHLWDGVHELAHLWLHAPRALAEGFARQYHSYTHEEAPDPDEDDAEIFAALVLGPRYYWRTF